MAGKSQERFLLVLDFLIAYSTASNPGIFSITITLAGSILCPCDLSAQDLHVARGQLLLCRCILASRPNYWRTEIPTRTHFSCRQAAKRDSMPGIWGCQACGMALPCLSHRAETAFAGQPISTQTLPS